MSEIKIVKLVSGECAIADCEDTDTGYLLKKPIVMMPTPDGMAMMPLSPLGTSNEIHVAKTHVLFTDSPEEEVKNVYNERFGTGIVTASGFNVIRPSR